MSTKPILFNTDMVRGLLDNRKTVTRRLVKPSHLRVLNSPYRRKHPETPDKVLLERLCMPPYRPGDILYVRETWRKDVGRYMYKADYSDGEKFYRDGNEVSIKWRPSIHMPREAARIFLRVTDVRVERLQDITAEQVLDEGVEVKFPEPKPGYISLAYTEMRLKPAARKQFADLWDTTIKKADRALYGWESNPWVWVIEFKRISREEATHGPG